MKYKRIEEYSKPKDAKELLILAREKEKASLNFYADMLKIFSGQENIAQLLESLKDEEAGHIKKIENQLEQLAGKGSR